MTRELNKDLSQKISVISFAEIEQTDFFKNMKKFDKHFFNQNKKHITSQVHHGYNVATHLGLEGWQRQTSSNYQVQKIVEELVNEGV